MMVRYVSECIGRRILNAVSLVKDTMFYNIKGFYKDDAFSSIPFESLSKESRIREDIDIFFVYVLDADITYDKSRICIPNMGDHKKNILYDCHNIFILSHPDFEIHMQ